MKKHYKGLALLAATAMLAGNGMTAYAGPADDIALQTGTQTQASSGQIANAGGPGGGEGTAYQPQQSEEDTSYVVPQSGLSVSVNYERDVADSVTAVSMVLNGYEGIGGVAYRSYNNYGGLQDRWSHDGGTSNLSSGGNWVQSIQIQLIGNAAKEYDIYYRVTSSGQGRMGWAKNGEMAGTNDLGEQITNIETVVVPKGSQAPVSGAPRFLNPMSGLLQVAENGTICYNADGSYYNGWLSYDFVRYYFQDGVAKTGWQYIDGYKYYFDSWGRLVQDVDELIGKQSSYLLKVNKTLNCLTVFAKDGSNGYIIPVKAMLTSVGDDTPIGSFQTPVKYRWRLMINDTYTQYATRITQGFLLHSITYDVENDPNSLGVAGYNGLGVSRSHGCVRLTCANSKWIYDNCELGTTVQIYEDANVASPFDKPDLVPIPDNQTWDPTDPLFQ